MIFLHCLSTLPDDPEIAVDPLQRFGLLGHLLLRAPNMLEQLLGTIQVNSTRCQIS